MSGGFALAFDRPKTEHNLGTAYRSALCMGASAIYLIGHRYRRQSSDAMATSRHLPIIACASWDDFFEHCPHGWAPVGVELTDDSSDLRVFAHPKSAVYLFAPEDGSLNPRAAERCMRVVSIPSTRCLNLAVAASIVMYDRMAKRVPLTIEREGVARA